MSTDRPKIFISHAVADKPLAKALADLLRLGMDIPRDSIFCSSLEGMGIPTGVRFIDFIHSQLTDADVVILLLSKNYFDSTFCLCEMGATWAILSEAKPVLVPPLKYEDAGPILKGVQAVKISDPQDLSQLCDELIALFPAAKPSTPNWEIERDKFLELLPEVLEKLPLPQKVDLEELEACEKRYSECLQLAKSQAAGLEKQGVLVESLKQSKDREEVAAIMVQHAGVEEGFRHAAEELKEALGELPQAVVKAI